MKRLLFGLLGLFLVLLSAGAAQARIVAFENGYWWQHGKFVKQNWYSVNGLLQKEIEGQVDEVIDLDGQFVLPPYAEGHNHNLQNPWLAQNFITSYTANGILYAAMLCGSPDNAQQTRDIIEQHGGVDVNLAGACISSSDGHPLRMALEGYSTPEREARPEDIYDHNYIVMDAPEDIQEKWDLVEQSTVDLVKLILVHHERPERRDDAQYFGINGLTAEVVRELVPAIHAQGLRAIAHTESAADFALAVEAGVDIIGHLPGYRWWDGETESAYRISRKVAEQAAEKGIKVIPTASVTQLMSYQSDEQRNRVIELQRENLKQLIVAGVPLLTGSDLFSGSVLDEVSYLSKIGLFKPQTLVDMLVTATPQALFPQRLIGRFEAGYEASFVTLPENPLDDLDKLKSIYFVVKKGRILLPN